MAKRYRRARRLRGCDCGARGRVAVRYDVPNDQFFTACLACGLQTNRAKLEHLARSYWQCRGRLHKPPICD